MERITQEQFRLLDEKVERILAIVSGIDANTAPCEEKQKTNQASMEAVLKMFDNSPLAKNPMFSEMLKTLKPILEGKR